MSGTQGFTGSGSGASRATLVVVVAALASAALLALAGFRFADPARAKDGSNFGNTCDSAAFTKDSSSVVDPIFEGANDHRHRYFGAPLVTNDDTGATLRGDQPTSCNRAVNSSAYWMPQVYRRGADGFVPLRIDTSKGLGDNTIYYQAGNVEPRTGGGPAFPQIQTFPRDFEVVARDANGPGDVKWGCLNGNGGLVEDPDTIGNCNSQKLTVRITFPQCWDGQNVPESADRPEEVKDIPASGRCSDLPADGGENWRAVPQITMSLEWLLPSENVGEIRVAGHGGLASTSTMHADFVNAWQHETAPGVDPATQPGLVSLNEIVERCIQNQGPNATTESKPVFCQDPNKRNPV